MEKSVCLQLPEVRYLKLANRGGRSAEATLPFSKRHRNANFIEDSANGERAENRDWEPRLSCSYGGG